MLDVLLWLAFMLHGFASLLSFLSVIGMWYSVGDDDNVHDDDDVVVVFSR